MCLINTAQLTAQLTECYLSRYMYLQVYDIKKKTCADIDYTCERAICLRRCCSCGRLLSM